MALSPVPHRSPLTFPRALSIAKEWVDWLQSVKDAIDASAQRRGGVSLSTQGAAIGTTAIPTPVLTAGLYRVSTYARITRAATVSSSLTVTVSWVDGGIACSQAFAAITGNTTGTVQAQAVMIRADQGTTVSYATAYASSGATSMQYALDVRLESMA
jgi:hypothetical protein